jgi:dienelactone hydrolase
MRSILSTVIAFFLPIVAYAQALPGTKLLEGNNDFAKLMVEGIERYLAKQTELADKERAKSWQPDFSTGDAFNKSVQPNRDRFRRIIGAIDQRLPVTMAKIATVEQSSLVAQTKFYKAYAVRWTVLPGMHGEGLLLEPRERPKACAVAIPDADWTPEQIVGVAPGVPKESQYARRLAEEGYRVVVPTLLNRQDDFSGSPKLGLFTNQPHREFVYRMAYEMGRHVIGYEVQKVLAAVDWLAGDKTPIEVWGYAEGGLLALYSAALDPRIKNTYISGYVNNRNQLHKEPIYRNVFGLLKDFGDAELLMLAGAPNGARKVNVEYAKEPEITGLPVSAKGRRGGAAPGMLNFTDPKATSLEYERFRKMTSFAGRTLTTLEAKPFADLMDPPIDADSLKRAQMRRERVTQPKELRMDFDVQARQKRQLDEAVGFTQNLLGPSSVKRQAHVWSRLNTSSLDALKKSQQPLRRQFHENIIGKLPESKAPLNPRTRLMYETPNYKAYEVVLDLNEDVICHGILLLPSDIKAGEKRPVVVCQHGLEGRPTDVCNPKVKRTPPYNSFGSQLAERGFIVFAPQNPYIFKNQFRQLVRAGNPLGLSLYSFIVAQHERILDWLETLPYVDATRIAYYGLSYGGKVAMRIPAILTRYCLSICSGDFNEWIWKNITLDWQNSYMFTHEYEMYEFDLANTFNYAEMAALIAPRPFMVERGHSDGVGLDEYVAFEYAKVRRFYAQLGVADRTEIEFFVGGHVIHGQGTFAFLHRHLNWPASK